MRSLIILRGYPASGKSTVGRQLELLRVGRFIDHNYLVKVVRAMAGEDEAIYEELSRLEAVMARTCLQEGNTVIVDGSFTTAASLMPLTTVAEELLVPMVVFRLDVSVETLRERVTNPDRIIDAPEFMSADILDRWLAEHPFQSWYGEHLIPAETNAVAVAKAIAKRLP